MKHNRRNAYLALAVCSLAIALASLALGVWWKMSGFYVAAGLGGLAMFLAGVGMRRE